jgi:hypothetical protein
MAHYSALLAPRDAARRLGISVSRVAQLDREGVLPVVRDSAGRRLFDPAVVDACARERALRRSQHGPMDGAAARTDGEKTEARA